MLRSSIGCHRQFTLIKFFDVPILRLTDARASRSVSKTRSRPKIHSIATQTAGIERVDWEATQRESKLKRGAVRDKEQQKQKQQATHNE
jgi:hypothetical protein